VSRKTDFDVHETCSGRSKIDGLGFSVQKNLKIGARIAGKPSYPSYLDRSMTGTLLMATPGRAFAPVRAADLMPGATKGIATPGETIYKSAHRRIVRSLAWLGGVSHAWTRVFFREDSGMAGGKT
jgi:hypothetical protein